MPSVHIASRWGILALLLLASCGGDSSPAPLADRTAECSNEEAKRIVFTTMQDHYLWSDEPEQRRRFLATTLEDFEDDRDLLDFLRFRPVTYDRGFTYISSASSENRQNAGRALSWGFLLAWEPDGSLRVQEAIEGGPVASAGVRRGWQLVSIDGRGVRELARNDAFSEALGYPDLAEGTTRTMDFLRTDGSAISLELSVDEFDVNPLPIVRIFENDGIQVGYVQLRSFVPPAVPAFEDAIIRFRLADVRRVIVDLRYNGGGALPVAEAIAGMLAGTRLEGAELYEMRFNQRNSGSNQRGFLNARYDDRELTAGDFEEVHFIGTQRSASASELLINGFRPWGEEVTTSLVGERTFGKPVGQAGIDYCNNFRRLRLVTFQTVNADGRGEFYNGLQPDCYAEDDLQHPLGDAEEGLLASALSRVRFGRCGESIARTTSVGSPASRDILAEPINGRYDGIL